MPQKLISQPSCTGRWITPPSVLVPACSRWRKSGPRLRRGGVWERGAGRGNVNRDEPDAGGWPGSPSVTLYPRHLREKHPGCAHRRPGHGEYDAVVTWHVSAITRSSRKSDRATVNLQMKGCSRRLEALLLLQVAVAPAGGRFLISSSVSSRCLRRWNQVDLWTNWPLVVLSPPAKVTGCWFGTHDSYFYVPGLFPPASSQWNIKTFVVVHFSLDLESVARRWSSSQQPTGRDQHPLVDALLLATLPFSSAWTWTLRTRWRPSLLFPHPLSLFLAPYFAPSLLHSFFASPRGHASGFCASCRTEWCALTFSPARRK